MAAKKEDFEFATNLSAEERIARAAEYQAHYLGRIADRLDRLVDLVGSGEAHRGLLREIQGLKHVIREHR